MNETPGSTVHASDLTRSKHGLTAADLQSLKHQILEWGHELGFQQLGITDTQLEKHENRLNAWLDRGLNGEMAYMKRHGTRRSRPAELRPGTLTVVSARMDYMTGDAVPAQDLMKQPHLALISRYALGRDYHKLLRRRLQQLATRIEQEIGAFGYRVYVDSGPVLEKALAEKAGLGWIGKHSNLLNRDAGSWFFLGEIYTDLPLPHDSTSENYCGNCTRCIDLCPTGAIVGPYQVDARRCISYLTIELRKAIPIELRPLIGNRIFGCDDCQAVCPWNRFARHSREDDFRPRNGLDAAQLGELFSWTEQEFLERTEGSAIRRIGHSIWLRNIAVALGNALRDSPGNTPAGATHSRPIVEALQSRLADSSELVREHVAWALEQYSAQNPRT